nr:SUMF1/EgtB/PvdO family nonheme iron enzyme [Kofleriaceae bacterium]
MRSVTVAAAAVALTQLAAARPGRVVRVEREVRRDVLVPAGVFTMGVDEEQAAELGNDCRIAYGFDDNGVAVGKLCDFYDLELGHMQPRQVFVSAFWMDRDEVSVADYTACIAAGACESDAMTAGDERYLSDDGPMVNVQWGEAEAFCRWRGGRLPTEAEWERAARGDSNGPWPWGTASRPSDFNHGKPYSRPMQQVSHGVMSIDELQGESDDSDGFALAAPPGHYAWGDGPFGTRDMAGNVAEWTADAVASSSPDLSGYDGLSSVDPVRTGSPGDSRVVRGGSWRQPEFLARVYARDPLLLLPSMYAPNHRMPYVGFRCVRPALAR